MKRVTISITRTHVRRLMIWPTNGSFQLLLNQVLWRAVNQCQLWCFMQYHLAVKIYLKHYFYVIITFKQFRMLGVILLHGRIRDMFCCCLLSLIDRAGMTALVLRLLFLGPKLFFLLLSIAIKDTLNLPWSHSYVYIVNYKTAHSALSKLCFIKSRCWIRRCIKNVEAKVHSSSKECYVNTVNKGNAGVDIKRSSPHLSRNLSEPLGRHRWPGNRLPPFISPLSLPHGGAQCHARPFRDVVLLYMFLSASFSPSLHCALQDWLGKPWRSCYVPVPFQFALLYCGQEVFVGPNGLPCSVSHLFIWDVVSVGDAEELSEASHLHGLYPSLCVSVQYSQAYRNMYMTRERISLSSTDKDTCN